MNLKPEIRLAGFNDLPLIRRFRFDVICIKDARSVPYADVHTREIGDQLDFSSDIYVAEIEGEIVGTIRTTLIESSTVNGLENGFGVSLPKNYCCVQSFTSRLVIDPRFRSLRVFDQLVKCVFVANYAKHVVRDYAACRPSLLPLFERYGWKQTQRDESGDLKLVILSLCDLAHLQSCKSPFLMYF